MVASQGGRPGCDVQGGCRRGPQEAQGHHGGPAPGGGAAVGKGREALKANELALQWARAFRDT